MASRHRDPSRAHEINGEFDRAAGANYTLNRYLREPKRDGSIMSLRPVILRGLLSITILTFIGGAVTVRAATGDAAKDTVGAAGNNASHSPVLDGHERKFPIPIPPASQLRSLLRQQRSRNTITPPPKDSPTDSVPQMLFRYGNIDFGSPTCNRAIPSRQEFLNMLRRDPGQANQILRSCNLNLGNLSPLPQLPTQQRQLPEDTRQRPVGTWGR